MWTRGNIIRFVTALAKCFPGAFIRKAEGTSIGTSIRIWEPGSLLLFALSLHVVSLFSYVCFDAVRQEATPVLLRRGSITRDGISSNSQHELLKITLFWEATIVSIRIIPCNKKRKGVSHTTKQGQCNEGHSSPARFFLQGAFPCSVNEEARPFLPSTQSQE